MSTLEPDLGFATTQDGVRIAFAKHGTGPPLVFVRGWIGQLDIFWSDPKHRAFFTELGRHFTVYRYDCRGNGLSDREVGHLSWPALISDIEAIVAQQSLRKFVLWGTTFGATIAVQYAAENPGKLSSLILDGGYLRGRKITNWMRQFLLVQSLRYFPEMAFLLLAHATSPTPHLAAYRRPEVVQQMISPRTAARLYAMAFKVDLRKAASRIATRTLVLHRRNSQSIPLRLGEELAGAIRDSKFLTLDGAAHNLWEENPRDALDAAFEFLGVEKPPTPAVTSNSRSVQVHDRSRKLAAIMHADVAGYTNRMESDEDGTHKRLVNHLKLMRRMVRDYGGIVHGEAGDALLAEFASAAECVKCAVEFQNASRELNRSENLKRKIEFRIGVHVGDVIMDESTLYGTGVNIAQRLQSTCPPGSVRISHSVYDATNLILPYRFEPLGQQAFKHLSSKVSVYQVHDEE